MTVCVEVVDCERYIGGQPDRQTVGWTNKLLGRQGRRPQGTRGRRHCILPGKLKASPIRGRRLGVLQSQATESSSPATKVIPALLTVPRVGRYAYSPQQAAEVCSSSRTSLRDCCSNTTISSLMNVTKETRFLWVSRYTGGAARQYRLCSSYRVQ